MARINLRKQTEKSTTIGSIVTTDASNEQQYTPPGANGTVLTIVAGIPTYTATGSSTFNITDGTTTQSIAGGDTLTFTDGTAVDVVVSATDTVTINTKISTDATNDLTFGTDGGLFLSKNALVTGASWNDATNTLVLTFDSGATANVPIVDLVSTFLSDFTISDGTTTDLVNNHETLLFAGDTLLKAVVTANTVTYNIDGTLGLAGQVMTTNGVIESWAYPVPRKQRDISAGLTSGTGFTLSQTPAPATSAYVEIFRNGILQDLTTDYTIAGTAVTFVDAFNTTTNATGSETVVAVYYY